METQTCEASLRHFFIIDTIVLKVNSVAFCLLLHQTIIPPDEAIRGEAAVPRLSLPLP